ncbi:hypothetical protein OPQ81_005739 [Rhizoctonia solani]|nr:hypothetical protein OPQ81_005739 [Rhizoctonia solani]
MRSITPKIALGLLSGSALTNALRIPVQKRAPTHHTSFNGFSTNPYSLPSLISAGVNSSDDSEITNFNNLFYTTNLTIAGVEIPVQLDTGSTDLWVYPVTHPGLFANVHNFTNVPVGVRYGKGSVDGYLAVANVSFAGFDVDDQAFIAVTSAKDMDAMLNRGTYGIIGLGFDALSDVVRAVQTNYNATWGRSLLSNLFLQEPSTPNHIAFALERAGDLDDMAEGAFDVGEILPQYAVVNNSPSIPLWPENANRWTVLLDGMNVNNLPVPLNSTFEGDNASDPPQGKSLALLDTGASFALIPKWAVDAIYGHIPGSVYLSEDALWAVPCMGEAKVTFSIGGVSVPIHPLDLTIPTVVPINGTNQTFCLNAFRPLTIDDLPFDFLLGDSFLRNVYAVYDFGDFDASGNMGKPYVKLLSLTDSEAASASFKKNRAASLAQLPPQGDATKLPGASDPLAKLAPIALALLGLNVLLLIGLIAMGVVFIIKQRKQGKGTPNVAGSNTRGSYVPVTKFQEDDDERSRTPVGRYDMPQYRDNA